MPAAAEVAGVGSDESSDDTPSRQEVDPFDAVLKHEFGEYLAIPDATTVPPVTPPDEWLLPSPSDTSGASAAEAFAAVVAEVDVSLPPPVPPLPVPPLPVPTESPPEEEPAGPVETSVAPASELVPPPPPVPAAPAETSPATGATAHEDDFFVGRDKKK
jgi:hypothetical protein